MKTSTLTVSSTTGFYPGAMVEVLGVTPGPNGRLIVVAVNGRTLTVRRARWWERAWMRVRNRARRVWWFVQIRVLATWEALGRVLTRETGPRSRKP